MRGGWNEGQIHGDNGIPGKVAMHSYYLPDRSLIKRGLSMDINYAKIVGRLEQIRKALVISIVSLLLVTVILYIKADFLIKFLVEPLGKRELVFLTPAEGLITRVKIAFLSALALCLPVILWQSVRIASEYVTARQKKVIYWIIPVAMPLFACGVLFGFKVAIPVILKFLLETGQQYMTATLSGNRYFSFILMLSLVMGAIFQLPLVMVVLAGLGIITSKMLRQKRKVAIIIILLLVGLMIPTPDILTLLAVSSPVLGLYELSVWSIFICEKIVKRKNKTLRLREV